MAGTATVLPQAPAMRHELVSRLHRGRRDSASVEADDEDDREELIARQRHQHQQRLMLCNAWSHAGQETINSVEHVAAGSIRRLSAPVRAEDGSVASYDASKSRLSGQATPTHASSSSASSPHSQTEVHSQSVAPSLNAGAPLEFTMQLEQLEYEFSQDRLRFTAKVEQEHAKLRAEVAAGSAGWRKEAESLAKQLAQLRSQQAQTSEAVIWAGKELGGIREELATCQKQSSSAPQSQDAAARVQQARAHLQSAYEAFESRCMSMDHRMEEMRTTLDGRHREFHERLEECLSGLAQTNQFFSQAISTISNDIAGLSQLHAQGADIGSLERSCGFESVEAPTGHSPRHARSHASPRMTRAASQRQRAHTVAHANVADGSSFVHERDPAQRNDLDHVDTKQKGISKTGSHLHVLHGRAAGVAARQAPNMIT